MKRLSTIPLALPLLAGAVLTAALFARPAPAQTNAPAGLATVTTAHDWIGTPATLADLRGSVVVLDVFTVDCYNCQNVVPTLRDLYARDRTRGLRVIGIHSPETPAERDRAYVVRSLAHQGITWPVAVDNSFALWRAYGVTAWPTQLFYDRQGRLRKIVVGDSQDARVRATVDMLLAEH